MSDVSVCTPDGPDSDGDGAVDWLDARRSRSRCDRGGVVRSRVSPFCLTGRSVWPDLVKVEGGTAARVLPDNGWWSDVALSSFSETEVVVSYENGLKEEHVSISWEPTDVFAVTNVVLRRGDSILLSADEDADVSIGGEVVAETGRDPVPLRFDDAGVFVMTSASASRTNAWTVTVVAVESEDGVPVWRGKTNSLFVNGCGFESMSEFVSKGADVASSSIDAQGGTFNVSVPAEGRPSGLAFLTQNPDAAVAGSVSLSPFSAYYTVEGKYYVFASLPDGTRVVENRLTAFDVPAGLELRMTSSSGICFEDGAGSLDVGADDFDEIGDCVYRFYVPSGVNHPCQFLQLRRNGKTVAK